MNKVLADFAQKPLEYDLSEMMDDEEIQEMARDVGTSEGTVRGRWPQPGLPCESGGCEISAL